MNELHEDARQGTATFIQGSIKKHVAHLSSVMIIGASTLVAQEMGQGDRRQTAATVTHCYLLVLAFTVTLAVIGQFSAHLVFVMLGAEEEVLSLAINYAKIWLIGFPMMGLAMVSNGLIRAFGNATYPGFIMSSAPIIQGRYKDIGNRVGPTDFKFVLSRFPDRRQTRFENVPAIDT
ncbi:MAG: MATE family efflux transporter [Pseudomonadales bacterium]